MLLFIYFVHIHAYYTPVRLHCSVTSRKASVADFSRCAFQFSAGKGGKGEGEGKGMGEVYVIVVGVIDAPGVR